MDPASPIESLDPRVAQLLAAALRRVGDYGEVVITIHQGSVQAIEERRRTRLQTAK